MKSKARVTREQKTRLSKTQEVLYNKQFDRANKIQRNTKGSSGR